MLPVFFLTLREGLEAALIVGIILAYLNRTERQEHIRIVWSGLVSALVLCAVVGGLIFQFLGGYDPLVPEEKNALRLFEGSACLLAAVVLTTVIVWMHRNARHLGKELRAAVDSAVEKRQAWALFGLVFLTVGREGLETILILPGISKGSGAGEVVAGIVLGLGIAIVIGVLLHRGAKVIDLQRFFKLTGILLIFFAAGLVAYGVHELQDAGKFPVVMKDVWNINHLLSDKEGVGLLLKSLFGYNGNPELLELLAYLSYLSISLVLFLRPGAPQKARTA
jgi:high-affinity iron transporter